MSEVTEAPRIGGDDLAGVLLGFLDDRATLCFRFSSILGEGELRVLMGDVLLAFFRGATGEEAILAMLDSPPGRTETLMTFPMSGCVPLERSLSEIVDRWHRDRSDYSGDVLGPEGPPSEVPSLSQGSADRRGIREPAPVPVEPSPEIVAPATPASGTSGSWWDQVDAQDVPVVTDGFSEPGDAGPPATMGRDNPPEAMLDMEPDFAIDVLGEGPALTVQRSSGVPSEYSDAPEEPGSAEPDGDAYVPSFIDAGDSSAVSGAEEPASEATFATDHEFALSDVAAGGHGKALSQAPQLAPLPWVFADPSCPSAFRGGIEVRDWVEGKRFTGALCFGAPEFLRLYLVKGFALGVEAVVNDTYLAGGEAALAGAPLMAGVPALAYCLPEEAALGMAILGGAPRPGTGGERIVGPCADLGSLALWVEARPTLAAAITVRAGLKQAAGWRAAGGRFTSARDHDEPHEGLSALEAVWGDDGVAVICFANPAALRPLFTPSSSSSPG